MRASLDASAFIWGSGSSGFRGSPFDLVDPHLPHDDVMDFTAMRAAFGLWFRVMLFHRADDKFAVAVALRTPPGAGAVEAFE
jgi:hypothetical protein